MYRKCACTRARSREHVSSDTNRPLFWHIVLIPGLPLNSTKKIWSGIHLWYIFSLAPSLYHWYTHSHSLSASHSLYLFLRRDKVMTRYTELQKRIKKNKSLSSRSSMREAQTAIWYTHRLFETLTDTHDSADTSHIFTLYLVSNFMYDRLSNIIYWTHFDHTQKNGRLQKHYSTIVRA